jgi:hypothetical protein
MRTGSSTSHAGVTGGVHRRRVISPTAPPSSDTATWPPSLQLLLGPPAEELWATVLGPLGGRLRALRATTVSLQPDGAATVQFSAAVRWADGRETRESLAATTGTRIPEGAAVLESGTVRVGLWRWPLDPALPGLAWASSAVAVGARLGALGLLAGQPRLKLRSYRPGRRAVIEVQLPEGRLFLKVVRPAVLDRLVVRHELLAGSVPVPPVLAALPDGVVVLPGLPGTSMRELLSSGAHPLPSPGRLDAVLDALPVSVGAVTAPGRHAPADALARVGHHGAVLSAVAPELRPRLTALATTLADADRGDHELVPVHGDFYEAQLLVDDGAVVGLLDLDTVGTGHRIDDWATLLAHLVLLEELLPRPGTAGRYRRELAAAITPRWPARQLRTRVAAVLVGLATGPFRVQQADWPAATSARLALAEHWARPA